MKSIFKYSTIILINFTATPTQAALIASRNNTAPTISTNQPSLDPRTLEDSLNDESNFSSLTSRVRRLSMQAQSLRKLSQGQSFRKPLRRSSETCNLGIYTFSEDEDLNNHHDPNEHSKNFHPSNDSEQQPKRPALMKSRQSISINHETTPETTPAALNNDLHITITRNQLHCIECFCLFVGTSLGLYHALKPASFQKRSMLTNLSDQPTEITRSGLPTDMIGAGFWGLNKLSSLASSGVTLVLAGFMLHKVKGWVDTIYASDTDRRINKKLEPIVSDLEKLAEYIDEKFKEVNNEQNNIDKATGEIAQEQAKHAQLLQETMNLLEEIAQENEKRNPTDQNAQEIVNRANTLNEQTKAAAVHAQHLLTQREEEQKHKPKTPKNPITNKVKSSNCCGCKQQ